MSLECKFTTYVCLHIRTVPEGSSHARKAMRRQKREQRERERQQTSRQDKYPPHHEFRLERRKSDFTELSRTPTASHATDSSRQPADPRHPAYNNPQFAKWIMEQNTLYGSEKGSRADIQSSMPSLTNIPKRDKAGSPVSSYVTTSTRHTPRRDSGDRGNYKPSTPPVRDSGSSRPVDYHAPSYSNFDNGDTSDLHSASDTGSKYSEYSAEPDHQVQPVSAPPFGSSSRPHLPPNFSTLSSQTTVGSQQMLTPYSQLPNPSQHQQQQLDKLSMDVLYHTQLSSTSGSGILAVLPKPNSRPARLRHLDSSNLKELEVDEIDLEKQRIHMMRLYEEQKLRGRVVQGSSQPSARRTEPPAAYQMVEARPQQNQSFVVGPSRVTDEIFAEMDLSLLREVESLERMVGEQKKKCRELKLAKEREERNMKQVEKQRREPEIMNGALDQHRWQKEQMRKLRELERIKAEQSKRYQQLEYDEHRAKNKLKALETQADEIREQLQRAESASQVLPPRTPGAGEEFGGMFPNQELLPSKLTSSHARSVIGGFGGHGGGIYRDGVHPEAERPVKLADHDHVTTPAERDWMETNSVKPVLAPSRVMSVDSVTTSTWVAPEQPDISKEIATTMSESNLTEPTQDDLPSSSVWSGYSSSKPSRGDLPSFLQSADLYSVTSNSKISMTDDTLSQEERLRRLKEESRSNSNGVPVGSKELRDLHVAQLQQEAMEQQPQYHQEYSTRLPSGTHVPNQGGYGNSTNNVEPPVNHTSTEAWKQQQPYRAPPPPSWSTQHHYAQPQAYPQPYVAQSTHQHSSGRSSNHHYSRSGRSRSHSRGLQQSNVLYAAETSVGSMHGLQEHPLQDGTARTSATPDLIPTLYGPRALSPRSSNLPRQLQAASERSFSPLSKFSDYSAVPQSPSYTSQALQIQHTVSPQTERERPSHPPVTSPSLKQEAEMRSKSPSETTRSRTTLSNTSGSVPEKYPTPAWQMPARSPISPTRPPTHDTIGKIGHWSHESTARSHDQRTASQYDRPQLPSEPGRPPNVSERDAHQPKPSAPHRYGMSRPDVKGAPHSYARRRPSNTADPMQQMSLDKVKLYMDRSYKTQAPRHPERIQRQQTEL